MGRGSATRARPTALAMAANNWRWRTGRRTAMSRGPLGQEDADSLLVLTPGAQHDAEAVAEVAHQGTRLVVLPKWAAFGDPQRRGWVRSAGVIPPGRVAAILPGEGKTRPLIAMPAPHLPRWETPAAVARAIASRRRGTTRAPQS